MNKPQKLEAERLAQGSINASIKAVLIDLDGTLMDTAADLAAAANAMRADLNLPPLPAARIAQFVGKGAEVLVQRAMTDSFEQTLPAKVFEPAKRAFFTRYHELNGSYATVFDGVPQALAQLQTAGFNLACVTNKPREFTLPLLARAKLAEFFDAVVAGDDVPQKKPHPALLLQACQHLTLLPQQSAMIGDSLNDALAANAAGCAHILLVETGYNEGLPLIEITQQTAAVIVPRLTDAANYLLACK